MGAFFDLFDPSSANSPVAPVSSADLKAAWALQDQALGRNSAQHIAVSVDSWKKVCSPEADISAVFLRVTLLRLLPTVSPEQFSPWIHDGQPDDTLFKVFGAIPMTGVPTCSPPREGLPFDTDELLRLLREESQG